MPVGIAPWPAHDHNPLNLSLQLSQTTVTPGEIITRTINGATTQNDVSTSADMTLEQFVDGSWRTLYFLELSKENPRDTVATTDIAIPAIALPPTALKARIPDVPPGTYRIRQDVTSVAGPTTLYATIHIVWT